MAVITLSGNTIGCCIGIGSFEGVGTAFSSAKQSVGSLMKGISTLKSKIDTARVAANVDTSHTQAQNAEKREETKQSALTTGYDKLENLISDVSTVDDKSAHKIRERKNDFYARYDYLKPDSEKTDKELRAERRAERWQKFKDFCSNVWEGVKSIGEWCKEHWKEILIGVAFIVVGALITVFTAGTGTAFWAAFGAALAKGLATAALSAIIGGGINAGITYHQYRKAGFSKEIAMKNAKKAFGDGAASGFMTGGISFGVGSAINAGAVALVGKTNLLVGHSVLGSIGRGAAFGATTNSVTSTVTTTISYWAQNGTLNGSGGEILKSAIIGGISGGICGGIAGGKQYINQRNLDRAFTDENLARTARGDQAANRSWGKDNNGNLKPNQGDNYSSYADYRQETTHPNQTVGKEITIKSDELSGKTRLDQTISDGNGNIIKGFELKSSDTATYQQGQKTYFADNGGKLVSDSMVTGAKSISQVGNQTLHVGTEIPTIRPSNFTEQIGVRLDNAFSPFTVGKPFEFTGITQENFLSTLKSLNSSTPSTSVMKSLWNNITVNESIFNSISAQPVFEE